MRNETIYDKVITVKMSQDQYDEINEAARDRGLPFSTFIRFSAIGAARDVLRKTKEIKRGQKINFRKTRGEV